MLLGKLIDTEDLALLLELAGLGLTYLALTIALGLLTSEDLKSFLPASAKARWRAGLRTCIHATRAPSVRRPHGLQDLERLPRALVPGEQLGSLQRPGGVLLTHCIVRHEAADRVTDARRIVRITIDRRVTPDLRQSAGPGSDDRAAARHRLELDKTK